MKVYVIIVDEMLQKNNVIDETSINRDVVDVCSSLDVALDYLSSNGYKCGKAPSYDVCSFHRVSDYYWFVYDHMGDGTEIVDCAWIEEREVAESIDYIWNDKDECLSKCCGNCKDFVYCTRNDKFNDEADVICNDFVLSDHAHIEYMD